MVETGQIIQTDDKKNTAKVRFDRKTACKNCGMCMFKKDDMHVDIDVENTLGAGVGDDVDIELKDNIVITAAIIAYALPVLMAGVGLLIGMLMHSEIFQLVFCLGFVILGYIIVIVLDRRFRIVRRINPRMLSIVENKEVE